MALTDVKVRSAKPGDKPYKLTDGEGMHLMVHPNGSKYWRFKYWRLQYRFDGKQKMLALGIYPEISLSEAREAKRQVANAIDPSEQKKVEKQTRKATVENTFKAIALEWHEYTSRLPHRYQPMMGNNVHQDFAFNAKGFDYFS